MKTIVFLIALLTLVSCSQKTSVNAVVRITDNSSKTEAIIQILESFDYMQQANKNLNLSETFGITESQAVEKMQNSIFVKPGNEPDLIVISAKGLPHEVGIKIVNELCTNFNAFVTEKQISDENGRILKEHLVIVQPAK